jgi:hypothetical protein
MLCSADRAASRYMLCSADRAASRYMRVMKPT